MIKGGEGRLLQLEAVSIVVVLIAVADSIQIDSVVENGFIVCCSVHLGRENFGRLPRSIVQIEARLGRHWVEIS